MKTEKIELASCIQKINELTEVVNRMREELYVMHQRFRAIQNTPTEYPREQKILAQSYMGDGETRIFYGPQGTMVKFENPPKSHDVFTICTISKDLK